VTYRISRELVRRGHEVTIFTTDASRLKSRLNIQDNPMFVDGVRVYHFPNVSNQLATKNLPIAPKMAVALNKLISSFDVVHLREYRTFNAAFVHYCSKKKATPFVLQPHGSLPTAVYNLVERQRLRSTFDQVYGRKILKDAAMIIALQETEANQCRQMGVDEHRIRIIPHAVDLADYESPSEEGAFRKKCGLKEDDLLVLYLGRIHKVKGIDLLLDAFCGVSKELKQAKLVIAGPDDGFLSVLEKKTRDMQLEDRVTFTGPLYDIQKLEAFRDADVYVLPSIHETFPNTVLEACACGTPVVVTDRCGIAQVIRNYGIVTDYDAQHLRDALLDILTDDAKRRVMAAQGQDMIKKEFTWDKVIKEIETTYSELAFSRARS
jgi:glycosyltransferase involved in cell wall biosynthesis